MRAAHHASHACLHLLPTSAFAASHACWTSPPGSMRPPSQQDVRHLLAAVGVHTSDATVGAWARAPAWQSNQGCAARRLSPLVAAQDAGPVLIRPLRLWWAAKQPHSTPRREYSSFTGMCTKARDSLARPGRGCAGGPARRKRGIKSQAQGPTQASAGLVPCGVILSGIVVEASITAPYGQLGPHGPPSCAGTNLWH